MVSGPATTLRFGPVTPVDSEDLVGTTYTLDTLITGMSASTVGEEPATLVLLADGTLQASTGCRSLSGTWQVVGDEVVVPELAAEGREPG